MFDQKEDNRNQRRDKKLDRRKNGMRMNRGAKMLANVIANKYQKLAFYAGDPLNPLYHMFRDTIDEVTRRTKK